MSDAVAMDACMILCDTPTASSRRAMCGFRQTAVTCHKLVSVALLHGPGRQPSHASAGQPERREGEDQLAAPTRSHLAPCRRRRTALLARCAFRRRHHHRLPGIHGRRGSLGAGAGAGVEWRGGEHGLAARVLERGASPCLARPSPELHMHLNPVSPSPVDPRGAGVGPQPLRANRILAAAGAATSSSRLESTSLRPQPRHHEQPRESHCECNLIAAARH